VKRPILYTVFFVSGTAGLMYQVLWMRYFQILFGNTAKAAAVVLAVFFVGMAIGSWAGGRLAQRTGNPLRSYGWIEIGITATAAAVPALLPVYEHLYPLVASQAADTAVTLDLVRVLMALVVTLPAAVLLGATFPVMGAVMVADLSRVGRGASFLYGLNTLGAVSGVILTGFLLPAAIGISRTYALALGLNALVGILILIGFRAPVSSALAPEPQVSTHRDSRSHPVPQGWVVLGLAFGSGAVLIGLEVLWTRMFALVFQNSVYSFSAIVLIVLVGLALSAFLVSAADRRISDPMAVLAVTLAFAAVAVALTPWLFFRATGLAYFAYGVGWPTYLYRIIMLVSGILLLPVLVAGATLPLLWRAYARRGHPVGATLGTVNLWNLLGAIAGAVGAGFVLIPTLGMWKSLAVAAAVLIVLSQVALWATHSIWGRRLSLTAVGAFVIVALFISNPLAFPTQRLKDGERLLYLDEGRDAMVSVVEEEASQIRWLKSNNTYNLGATASVRGEKRLGHLPLLLHPSPKDAAFVGVGTGISMSAALDHPVDHVVGIEILPGVIDAVRYFSKDNHHLLDDPRVRTVTDDGRVYLRTTDQRFDVIVSDLFVPWHAGTGSLYTLEHFEASREHLNPGGLYCQWLPLYQMSEQEFGSIAATFAQAFPHVSIWRGDFSSTAPIVGLVGSNEPLDLNPEALRDRMERLTASASEGDPLLRSFSDFTLFYGGDLTLLVPWFRQFPLNTDDQPVVEFQAPINQMRQRMFNGDALVSFFTHVQDAIDPVQVARRSVRMRSPLTGESIAVSTAPGNLLFQAVAAGVNQDVKGQLATIKQAVELLPGSDFFNVVDVVIKAMDARATRGLVEQGS
jgi:spermidine synthase